MSLDTRCRQHWSELGITDKSTLQERIKTIFEKHCHQERVLVDIYRLVLPDWEQIKEVEGYPEAGDELWKFICRLFQDFDRKNHPDVMPGGIWMNTGFSVNRGLCVWKIGFDNCKVIMT